jgi:succinate dehydrogenase/fumarate reductase cytochrome b subunit
MPPTGRSARAHAVLAALPLSVWTVFHLWEQWSVFRGREAWLARMAETSRGALPIAIELAVAILPLAAWSALALADLARGRRPPGASTSGDRGAVRVLGTLAPIGTVLAIFFLLVHVVHLWLPKLTRGASAAETWFALTHAVGQPWMLVLYAIGLMAIAIHLAAAIPAALAAVGRIETAEQRRSALLVSSVFAACVWVLAAQLTGWLGTGRGTFWPIEVVEPAVEGAEPEPIE